MQDSSAPGAIRISLFQTAPGKELEVEFGDVGENATWRRVRKWVG